MSKPKVRQAMRETIMELLEYVHPKPIAADKAFEYMISLCPHKADYAGRDSRGKVASQEMTKMQELGLIALSKGYVMLGHAANLI